VINVIGCFKKVVYVKNLLFAQPTSCFANQTHCLHADNTT